MPTYKGNRGNLLQHWVLAELTTLMKSQIPPSAHLGFVDAHAMSPYATRDPEPGSSAREFDHVRHRLPGEGSYYERAWADLARQEDVEYPTSAMFVRHLWPGPLSMVLCEIDGATADGVDRWKSSLPAPTDVKLYRGDWRKRLRRRLPRTAACIVSFDPYMIISENAASLKSGHMYLADIVSAAVAVAEIECGPLVVQLSTYKAQGNSQEKIIPIVEWVMAAVGIELIETVRADGHMMSMIFGRDLLRLPKQLHERFNLWRARAIAPA